MKKTLITLLAFSGMSFGATLSELPSHVITLGDASTTSISSGSAKIWIDGQGGTYDKNFDNGWMMEFIFNSYTPESAENLVFFKAQGGDGGLELSARDNSILFTDKSGDSDMSSALTLYTDVLYRASYDKTAQAIYLTNTETGDYVTGTWPYDGWGNTGTYAGTFYTNDKITIEVGKAYDMEGITGDSFKEYATIANVPEPATSTLSLLALAGLVARRRR